jgi:sugar (pentulose or hexulose) kinase
VIDATMLDAGDWLSRMDESMQASAPRGIAVVDVGYTNTKIALFAADGQMRAEHKVLSRHLPGPPYPHIDPEPMVELCRNALPELDAILPVDAVVPCAHGAAMACLDDGGNLALPVMDYASEPPSDIVEDYRKIMPGFAEALCPLLPMAITHGLQLYWQQRQWPEAFASVRTILPWIQYVGFRLSGLAVSEISSMSCQTHLMDTRLQQPSAMARHLGWDRLFPPMAKAWQAIGTLLPQFRPAGFRGKGLVLGGVHDSTANFMRYVCAGLDRFTLVSTGTWSISFDPSTAVDVLDPARDTNTNTDVLGRTVCCSRFFGGKEFEVVAGGAVAEAANLAEVARLVARGTKAVPSFTMTSGPVPGSLGKGFVTGHVPVNDTEKASLAALYCAQMVSEQLDAIASKDDIIVDGPYSQNAVLLAVLAGLRPAQKVKASALRDGTTAGAAAIALIADGKLPSIALDMSDVVPAAIPGLAAYHADWRATAYAQRASSPASGKDPYG